MRTLGATLVLAVGLPTLLVAGVGVGFVWHTTRHSLERAASEQAEALATFITVGFEAVEPGLVNRTAEQAHGLAKARLRNGWARLAEARVVGADGVILWSTTLANEGQPASPLEGPRASASLGGSSCEACHASPSLGQVEVALLKPATSPWQSRGFRQALSLLVIFFAALTLGLGAALHVFLGRPMRRLASAMQRAEAGDFVVRAPPLGRTEIGQLALAFNRMLARLTDLKAQELEHLRERERAEAQAAVQQAQAQSQARLAHRVAELEILYDNARTLSSSLELDEVLNRLTRELPGHLHVSGFSLMLVDTSGQLEVKRSAPTGSEGITFALDEGVCGKAAHLRKAVYVSDVSTDTRFKQLHQVTQGSLLAVPMEQAGDLLGVLNFERTATAAFSAEDIEFFTAVAGQIGMAVKNARLHEETVNLTLTDPLTHVANRRALNARLTEELSRVQRYGVSVALVMIDIDHFKHLNDASGHLAGDEVLQQVASILSKELRRVDLIARYGGEEFAIVLPSTTKAEAVAVAQKLRALVAALDSPYAAKQPLGRLTISLGVAASDDSAEFAKLIDCADSALYASKRGGRNHVSAFTPGMELHPGRERGPHTRR
jgi:diguanylate cyclase (GGDEF)-like protein